MKLANITNEKQELAGLVGEGNPMQVFISLEPREIRDVTFPILNSEIKKFVDGCNGNVMVLE